MGGKMTFTKTDFRQFLDEIQLIGKRKELSGALKESFKWFGLCKAENALDVKRKTYDHLYTNVFRKYGIVPDDLYSDLDEMWGKALQCDQWFVGKILSFPNNESLMIVWNAYIEFTIEYARETGTGKLK
jgi:hypothetical protein